VSNTGSRNATITVAVVDDDTYIRNGLSQLLNNVVGMNCVGSYATPDEFINDCATWSPDLLLLDVSLKGSSGIDAIPTIKKHLPNVAILMHSNYDDHDNIVRSREAGASGYMFKNSSAPALYDAILEVAAGGSAWPPGYDFSKESANDNNLVKYVKKKLRFLLGKLREQR